jgi:hypothetical protein
VPDAGVSDEHDHLLGIRAVPKSANSGDLVLPLTELSFAELQSLARLTSLF